MRGGEVRGDESVPGGAEEALPVEGPRQVREVRGLFASVPHGAVADRGPGPEWYTASRPGAAAPGW
ncbi:hypothetical protein BB341_27040 [Streptomyces clavuligerus]|nr:hypothetical protein BB341_27040 [Streptomyces clavuligerus]AXU16233.1 hypothetical protein D1794_28105 [Streptomyces clavuligerus]QCS09013.1 hypothetical protein CRV15_27460 [Streptomyces clavuligerus]